MEGASLNELQEKPTKEDVWKWSRELVSALHMCHTQANVAHRDIKPANLKLDGQNKDLVLCDFGDSLCFDDGENQDLFTNTAGTYLYFAPEIVSRQ